jgi:hypothetical protein
MLYVIVLQILRYMNDQTLSAKKEKAVADYIIQMVCIDSGSDRTIVGFTSTYANVRPMGSIHPIN